MLKSDHMVAKIRSPQCLSTAKEWNEEKNKLSCVIKFFQSYFSDTSE